MNFINKCSLLLSLNYFTVLFLCFCIQTAVWVPETISLPSMSPEQRLKSHNCLGCTASFFFFFFPPNSLQALNTHSYLIIWIQKSLGCVAVTEIVPEDLSTWVCPHSSTEGFLKLGNREDLLCQGLRCMLLFPSRGHTPPSESCKSSHKVTTMTGETQPIGNLY